MIYIVCPNMAFGYDYVTLELHGDPTDREIRFITNDNWERTIPTVQLVVGDKVHVISGTGHELSWRLYRSWAQLEVDNGLPPRQNIPYLR